MKNYQELLARVLKDGTKKGSRGALNNGQEVYIKSISGLSIEFDLREGFPLLQLRRIYPKSIIAELLGFLRGYTSAKDFRDTGTGIWDENANVTESWLNNPNRVGEDDLGLIYGYQWNRECVRQQDGTLISQLQSVLNTLHTNPTDRRMIVNAWRPDDLHRMALPPCHMMWQVISDGENLDLVAYIRSSDLFLGLPYNIASYAALLEILSAAFTMKARRLVINLGDAHLYNNQFAEAREVIERYAPTSKVELNMPFPILGAGVNLLTEINKGGGNGCAIGRDTKDGYFIQAEDFIFDNYNPLEPIKVEMVK